MLVPSVGSVCSFRVAVPFNFVWVPCVGFICSFRVLIPLVVSLCWCHVLVPCACSLCLFRVCILFALVSRIISMSGSVCLFCVFVPRVGLVFFSCVGSVYWSREWGLCVASVC